MNKLAMILAILIALPALHVKKAHSQVMEFPDMKPLTGLELKAYQKKVTERQRRQKEQIERQVAAEKTKIGHQRDRDLRWIEDRVHIIYLEDDGTKCVVFVKIKGAGIDCDWDGNRKEKK